MITLYVQDQPVQLRAFHDLSAIASLGRVFRVYDQLTSGLLAFGIQRGDRRLFVKYAGAPTLNYPSDPKLAVERLRRAAPNYAALRHPALVPLLEVRDGSQNCLCIFDWLPGVPLGLMPEHYAAFRQTSLTDRLRMYDAVADLNARAEAQELVIAGLSDTHMMYLPEAGRLVLTNIDDYLPLPSLNVRGRLPGSPFYLPPEGYHKGAALDETSSVYALGALAHAFFGDRANPSRKAWEATDGLFHVAARATDANRDRRYQSTAEYLAAWRQAVLTARF